MASAHDSVITPTFTPSVPRQMFAGPYVLDFGSFDVSSDGERFLLVKPASVPLTTQSEPPSLTVVQNWFEALKRLVPTE